MWNMLLTFSANRLRENTTWLGLIVLASALGYQLRPELADAIVYLGVVAFGGVAVLTPNQMRVLGKTVPPTTVPPATVQTSSGQSRKLPANADDPPSRTVVKVAARVAAEQADPPAGGGWGDK